MKAFVWALVTFTVLSDQAAKFLASQSLTPGAPRAVVEGFFYLTLVHNTGAAFGVFPNQALFFLIVSGLTVIMIVIFLRKKYDIILPRDLGFALILGGAVGNLIDRVRLGYVVDFFDFRIWPVFNVADSAITVGAFLIIISVFRKRREA
ncbi:MAG: signal peptidase II [Omnitrophica bacterium]|nr:signal peptidase II [Candidatus Omnitrophota bacterium]